MNTKYKIANNKVPFFPDSLGLLEAKVEKKVISGDHTIIICLITNCIKLNTKKPLIYYKSKISHRLILSMKYINSSFEEINIDEKLCLTIGNFDGIHKGHREIIKNLIQKTKISKSKSAILSFTPHPKIYFKKQNNFMINSQLKKKRF